MTNGTKAIPKSSYSNRNKVFHSSARRNPFLRLAMVRYGNQMVSIEALLVNANQALFSMLKVADPFCTTALCTTLCQLAHSRGRCSFLACAVRSIRARLPPCCGGQLAGQLSTQSSVNSGASDAGPTTWQKRTSFKFIITEMSFKVDRIWIKMDLRLIRVWEFAQAITILFRNQNHPLRLFFEKFWFPSFFV